MAPTHKESVSCDPDSFSRVLPHLLPTGSQRAVPRLETESAAELRSLGLECSRPSLDTVRECDPPPTRASVVAGLWRTDRAVRRRRGRSGLREGNLQTGQKLGRQKTLRDRPLSAESRDPCSSLYRRELLGIALNRRVRMSVAPLQNGKRPPSAVSVPQDSADIAPASGCSTARVITAGENREARVRETVAAGHWALTSNRLRTSCVRASPWARGETPSGAGEFAQMGANVPNSLQSCFR